MNRKLGLLGLFALFVSLLSCKDNQDKLLDDADDVLDKIEGVLLDLKDGKISASEAADELEGVNEVIAGFEGRVQELKKEGELNEKDPEWKRKSAVIEKKADRVRRLLQDLEMAGKITPELKAALEKF